MDRALGQLKIIWFAMLLAAFLYPIVGEIVGRQNPMPPNPKLLPAFTVVGAIILVGILVVRRLMIAPVLPAVSVPVPAPEIVRRWRGGYLVTYAFAEGIALQGLVLRILGFRVRHVASFYIVAFLLLLFFTPRRPAIR